MKQKRITILAIETSCDDTGVAIIKAGESGSFKVLSNIISSQVEIHKKWGGVYPMMAKREHQRNLLPVLIRALKESKLLKISNFQFSISNKFLNSNFQTLKEILSREELLYKKLITFLRKYQKPNIDLIAVTNGPGLELCLWVGVNFAKALSYYWDIPIVPVNHIKAHILVNFLPKIDENLKRKAQSEKPQLKTKKLNFPAICLVVSGGHTLLFLMKDFDKYEVLGETRDDAAGECFDKTARILGLGYPGGPAIAKQAAKLKIVNCKLKIRLPRPMITTKDYDFSFSGLKTAVLYDANKRYGKVPLRSAIGGTTEGRQYIRQMCAEIQQSVIDVLIKKTINAAINRKAKSIILGGGVVANKELRKQFQERVKKIISNVKLLFPKPENCTDNALMTAIAGYFKYRNPSTRSGQDWKNIEVNANLRLQ